MKGKIVTEKLTSKSLIHATKWSIITEVLAKLASPVTNMVLARVLVPEVFGVVATIAMVISFADMLTDAGFQKYLIQHEFKDENEFYQSTTVAFWTNLCLSLALWGIIAWFQDPIASIVGNPGLGYVIAVAGISLPLTSFSSIQMALFRRDFDYKTLFYVRIVGVVIPFFVTIPLSFLIRNYWALIIGTIAGNLANAIMLTCKSKWKPYMYYSFRQLKGMFSFTGWTLLEQISIWLTSYIGTFIVGTMLSQYYLGLYKTSISIVNQFMSLVTASTTTVLFSALSRLQKDKRQFEEVFFKFQRNVALLLLPMGVGVYQYRIFCTRVLLGNQWLEAADFIGLWGLTSAITIVLSHYCSEVYRSRGRPRLSLLSQLLHLVALVPALVWASSKGFIILYQVRSYIRIEGILVNLVLMAAVIHISPLKMLINIAPSALSAAAMGILAIFLKKMYSGLAWDIISIFSCAVFYFCMIMLFPNMRDEVCRLTKKITRKPKTRPKGISANANSYREG